MEYGFLYDRARHLLAIGYNVGERRRDASYYDLLASEARFASFVAIAQGQLPQENWFALGRLLTTSGGQARAAVVERLDVRVPDAAPGDADLRQHAARPDVLAWRSSARSRTGSSAACRGASRNAATTRSTRASTTSTARSACPGLGLKRGLAEDLVVAPYASALALMVAPEEACVNLQRLAADGLAGRFGFYEAIDYTPARLPRGQPSAVVRSFMAHHQGMILLSLAHVLLGRPMQQRFESDPLFKATLLLLQERIPKAPRSIRIPPSSPRSQRFPAAPEAPVRVFEHPDTPVPEVQLLSNGRYHVMVTNAGGGSTPLEGPRGHPLARGQHVRQLGHVLLHPRRGERGVLVDRAPADAEARRHATRRSSPRRARNSAGATTISRRTPRSSFRRKTTSSCAGCASPTARGRGATIDVTSYAEVVLAPPAADALHPAFSNLFVQTEIVARAAGDPVHAPAALARRAAAVDVPPHGRPRAGVVGRFLRDRPHGVHRPRPHGRRPAAMTRRRDGSPAARARCWIRSSRSGIGSRSIRSRRRPSTWLRAWPRRATPR